MGSSPVDLSAGWTGGKGVDLMENMFGYLMLYLVSCYRQKGVITVETSRKDLLPADVRMNDAPCLSSLVPDTEGGDTVCSLGRGDGTPVGEEDNLLGPGGHLCPGLFGKAGRINSEHSQIPCKPSQRRMADASHRSIRDRAVSAAF